MQIKKGKAFGEDEISPEVMKRVDPVDLNDIVLKFCNDALDGVALRCSCRARA